MNLQGDEGSEEDTLAPLQQQNISSSASQMGKCATQLPPTLDLFLSTGIVRKKKIML